jgi:hypothetical protein
MRWLQALVSRFGQMDPLHKVRLLLSALFLRQPALEQVKPQLLQLSAMACSDDDEWVRVIGRAVGQYDGRLDLDGVVQDSSLVRVASATVLRTKGSECRPSVCLSDQSGA